MTLKLLTICSVFTAKSFTLPKVVYHNLKTDTLTEDDNLTNVRPGKTFSNKICND